jgi:hypothetical protein
MQGPEDDKIPNHENDSGENGPNPDTNHLDDNPINLSRARVSLILIATGGFILLIAMVFVVLAIILVK